MPVQQGDARAEIAEILSARRDQYACATVRVAIALDDSGQWRNCLALVQLSDEEIEPRSLVYPSFEIIEAACEPDSVLGMVDDLLGAASLSIAGKTVEVEKGAFYIRGEGRVGERVASRASWFQWEWPGSLYIFGGHQAGGIHIEVETGCAEFGDLVAKAYAVSGEGVTDQRDVGMTAQVTSVDVGFRPAQAKVCILSKLDGQLLDAWDYPPSLWGGWGGDAPITAEDVRQAIELGEDNHTEFKPGTRDDTAKGEIAESAIAFANREGGIVLLDVDDNGVVVGAHGGGLEEVVMQSLRDRCDPPIEPGIVRVTIDDKPVYVVAIRESERKPHMMRGNGVVYVRVGSTDRPATRGEFEEFFSDHHSGIEGPFRG